MIHIKLQSIQSLSIHLFLPIIISVYCLFNIFFLPSKHCYFIIITIFIIIFKTFHIKYTFISYLFIFIYTYSNLLNHYKTIWFNISILFYQCSVRNGNFQFFLLYILSFELTTFSDINIGSYHVAVHPITFYTFISSNYNISLLFLQYFIFYHQNTPIYNDVINSNEHPDSINSNQHPIDIINAISTRNSSIVCMNLRHENSLSLK